MKTVRLTEEIIEKCVQEFKEKLQKSKEGITIPTKVGEKHAFFTLTAEASKKLWSLVDTCDKEVAWHGFIKKEIQQELPNYICYDIVVFPQTVTGTTVTSDEQEYTNWLYSEIDDDMFNAMRMHGHSHVNMGTTPSGVDTTYQDEMLANIVDFYIFGIFNKKRSHWLKIVDITDNIIYENEDIGFLMPEEEETWAEKQLKRFVKEAPRYAKGKKCTAEVDKDDFFDYNAYVLNQIKQRKAESGQLDIYDMGYME